jgi:flagellar biosynthesis/type III secretory pathway chaperone
MPVNKNHTERIAALEQHKEDTLNLPRRIKEMEDEQSNQEISIENLHARLEEIEKKFPVYQTTNERNVTLLFEKVEQLDQFFHVLSEKQKGTSIEGVNVRLANIENRLYEIQNPKKNTKNISIAQLVKALLFIPFTTLKG